MVAFTTATETHITRAATITKSSTGWPDAVGGALRGMADELGDASLRGTTGDGGNAIRADADGDIQGDQLPTAIPVNRLSTGENAGDIPIVQNNGRLLNSIQGLRDIRVFEVSDDNIERTTFTADGTWTKPDTLRYLFIRMCGAGGRIGAARGDDDIYLGEASPPLTTLLPAFLVPSSVNVVVGQFNADSNYDRTGYNASSKFGDLLVARGGRQRHFSEDEAGDASARLPTEAEANGYVRHVVANYQGISGIEGETDPSHRINFLEGTIGRPPLSRVVSGFGAPGVSGVVEVWAVRV